MFVFSTIPGAIESQKACKDVKFGCTAEELVLASRARTNQFLEFAVPTINEAVPNSLG